MLRKSRAVVLIAFIPGSSAYSKKSQAEYASSIYNENMDFSTHEVLIDTGSHGSNYFAKGHLAPDADFVFDAQQVKNENWIRAVFDQCYI